LFIRSRDEKEGSKIVRDMQVKGFFYYSAVVKAKHFSNNEFRLKKNSLNHYLVHLKKKEND
jgi:hypothetical protein